MEEPKLKEHINKPYQLHVTSLNILFGSVIFFCLILFVQYRWKRRRMYELANKLSGPKQYPIIGSALLFRGSTEDILNTVLKIVHEYKPVTPIWLANTLFFAITKAEHLEIIFNHPESQGKHELYKFLKPLMGYGLFTAPVPIWKRNRKILSPTFNQKILNNFVSTYYEQSVILTEVLEKHVDKIIDIKHLITKFTLDTVAKTGMGIELHEQTSNSEVGSLIDNIARDAFKRMFQIWLHPDIIFYNSSIGKQFTKNINIFLDYTDRVIKDRRIQYEEHKEWCKQYPEAETDEKSKFKTFLELLFELNDNDNKFSDVELRDEINTFLVAGSDTTSVALSFALIMLGMHPEYQQMVYEEVMDVIGPDRHIEYDDLPNLKYTERVVFETNRLFPVGPLIVRNNNTEIDLGDCILPAGSASVLVILYTHRSEIYWKDPLLFNPDRFLPEEVAKRHPYCYTPFAAGPRTCIGKKYGIMMMKLAIAQVVRRYKLKTPYKTVTDIKLRQDTLIQPVDGYKIQLEYRDNSKI